MNTIQRSIFFIFLFISFAVSEGHSQQDTIPTSEIEVFKSFEARLMKAEKLHFNPVSQLPDTSSYRYSYQFRDFGLKTEPRPGIIKPLPMTFEEPLPVYNGFFKGGYGIPNAPFAEAGYSIINSRDFRYTFYARHQSFKDREIDHKRMMDNDFKFDGVYQLTKELGIRAGAGYSFDDHFLYGYDQDSSTYTDEAARRRYKDFTFTAGLFNQSRKDYDFSYHGDISFYNFKSDVANKENSIRLDIGANKKFTNEISGSLEIIPETIRYKDTIEQTINSIEIEPELEYVGKSFSVKIVPGVHLSGGQTNFLPDARLAIPVYGNAIIAVAEIDGDASVNSYKNLTSTNPYLHTRLDSMRYTFTRTYALGIEGFLKGITYKAKTGYKTFNDIAGFINNPADRRMFLPVYDDVNAVFIEGSMTGKPTRFLELQFKWRKHFFTEPETQGELWHIPSQEGSLSVTVIPFEIPLRVNATMFYEGRVHYLDETGYPEKTNSVMDFNLGADYFISERFGLYLQVNNLLGIKRERWAGYEGFGINLSGGVLARF